jgi:hypothetical protein
LSPQNTTATHITRQRKAQAIMANMAANSAGSMAESAFIVATSAGWRSAKKRPSSAHVGGGL